MFANSIPSLTDPCIHVLKHGRSLESLISKFQPPGYWCRQRAVYSSIIIKASVDVSSHLHQSVERWWNWLPRDLPWLIDERTFCWLYCALSELLIPNILTEHQQASVAEVEWDAGTRKLGCMNFDLYFQYLVAVADNFSPHPDPDGLASFLDTMLNRIKGLSPEAPIMWRPDEAQVKGYRGYSISQGLMRNEKGWTKLPLATSKFNCTKCLSYITKYDPQRQAGIVQEEAIGRNSQEIVGGYDGDVKDRADEGLEEQESSMNSPNEMEPVTVSTKNWSESEEDRPSPEYDGSYEDSDNLETIAPYSIKIDLKRNSPSLKIDLKCNSSVMGTVTEDDANHEVAQILHLNAGQGFLRQVSSVPTRPRSVIAGSVRRSVQASMLMRPHSADLVLHATVTGPATCLDDLRFARKAKDADTVTYPNGDEITNLWRSQARPGHVTSGPRPCIFGCPSGLYPPLRVLCPPLSLRRADSTARRVPKPGPQVADLKQGLQPLGTRGVPASGRMTRGVAGVGLSAQRIPRWAAEMADRAALTNISSSPPQKERD
jgi:hypothetical protein